MRTFDYNIEYINNDSIKSDINSRLVSDITYYEKIKNEVIQSEDLNNVISNNISHINFNNYITFIINKNIVNLDYSIIPDYINIIQYYINDDVNNFNINNIENIIVDINNIDLSLNFNTKYNFRYGISDGINTFWTNYTEIITETEFINLNLVILNITSNTVEISWLKLYDSDYLIQISNNTDFTDSKPIPFKSQKTRHIIKNLNPNTEYFIRVGQKLETNYIWCNIINFKTLIKKKFLGLF